MPQLLEIKLTPLGTFFFGQEIVFGGGLGADDRRRSYLVHSGNLPQQTSLLGMLRETILRQHSALLHPGAGAAEKKKAASLVGGRGFAPTHTGNYGIIQSLSPVLLQDQEGKYWQPHPLDDTTGKMGASLQWQQNSLGEDEEGQQITQWLLRNYDPKNELITQFASAGCRRPLTNFFKQQEQVGVRLNNRNAWKNRDPEKEAAEKEEGFFRQTQMRNGQSAYAANLAAKKVEADLDAYQFETTYSFVFRVLIEPEASTHYKAIKADVVTLGGERSSFKLEVATVAADTEFIAPVKYQLNSKMPGTEDGRLVLLSDAFVPQELLTNETFVVAHTRPFRFFTTDLQKTENFYFLAYDKHTKTFNDKGRKQSVQYTLLERGGVILGSRNALIQLEKAITSNPAFHQIGYNYCKLI